MDNVNFDKEKELIFNEAICKNMKSHYTNALDKVKEELDKVPQVNASAEVIDARGDKNTLGEKVRSIDSALDTIALNVKSFGAKGDGVTDDSEAIKNTLMFAKNNGFKTVLFETNKTYMVKGYNDGEGDELAKTTGINIPSGITVDLNGATIKCIANNRRVYYILSIINSDNVVIKNGKIIGERYSHVGATGEWGYGIALRGATNITLENLYISDCFGDGINIQENFHINGGKKYCENVTIKKVICDNNRRQGCSVEAIKNCLIIDSVFKNTNGTAPSAGIDIEPWDEQFLAENITITNCEFLNNVGGGVIVFGGNTHVKNNTITNNYFENNGGDGSITIFKTENTTVSNNIVKEGQIASTRSINCKISCNTLIGSGIIVNISSNLEISNNKFYNFSYQAINIPAYGGDYKLNRNRNIKIKGNVFYSDGTDNITYAISANYISHLVIEENDFIGSNTAIQLATTINGCSVSRNYFIDVQKCCINTKDFYLIVSDNFFEGCNWDIIQSTVALPNVYIQNNIVYKQCRFKTSSVGGNFKTTRNLAYQTPPAGNIVGNTIIDNATIDDIT